MAKISIEEALKTRLALPWKKRNLDGSVTWEILRQRPDSMTAAMYCDLRTYGLKDGEIRELFYVMPADWATLKNRLEIEYTKSSKSNNTVSKRELGASRLASIAANKLPKVEVSTPPTFPEAASTKQENVDIAPVISLDADLAATLTNEILLKKIDAAIDGQGPIPGLSDATIARAQAVAEQVARATREQVETFFAEQEESVELTVIDLSGWEAFDLSKSFTRPRSLIAGTTKLYIGVGVKFIKDWDRCCVKIRPDGKQIALEKVIDAGYKVGKDHQRPAITCRKATEMLCKIVGNGAEYVPIIEQEGLVVFEYRGGQ